MKIDAHVEHLFRHEYGQLVALLVRRLGMQHLDMANDAVQWAMAQALEHWPKTKPPTTPSAWLYQVAYRHALSEIRGNQLKLQKLTRLHEQLDHASTPPEDMPLSGELNDALLRMLFISCDEDLALESQLVFTLKSLCGFSIEEIAYRLFISEANTYKRYSRAKHYLQAQKIELDGVDVSTMASRLSAVHRVIYLMFTEGYLSSHKDLAIRHDLCEEAIRLGQALAKSTIGGSPETDALLALMLLNFSRIQARQNAQGLVLLQEQNRTLWDQQIIRQGLAYLQRSASGESLSRYHVEAGIAAEHCLAPSYQQTDWQKVVQGYQLLEQIAPSPFHILNRAIAIAEWQGAAEGLRVLNAANFPVWLERSYHWFAVLADLQYRCGEIGQATNNAELALAQAPTENTKQLLLKRLSAYNTNGD
ncbi:DNA-directed RNA polymerase sigma-70 factor [Agarivorans sp. Toyoura001]|uniref:RNA polymerase sigma factor n=1 Tax=Agarivorans sp. Toyoura001 TaxID=2283141 RepID=UPI0010D75EB5|nr:sigma-70 family RNA polymerase sigma factor [Agarivorans sp. Toyoura001]GDY24928.1 DNA-directed RNA polymerase sigma-70 factor [Agarivorans sp. Toyoura001]